MLVNTEVEYQPYVGAIKVTAPNPCMLPIHRNLLKMMQDLSHARTLDTVIGLVREQARVIARADGVTFVLKDQDQCHYVDENAIGPLWKGRHFPLSSCISGWAMLNKKAVAIEDIYKDSRIPLDVYRTTFVKSLAMVPIRQHDPIGAIGIYWEQHHKIDDDELELLQALADSVSIAMENVTLYSELQNKVQELQESNHELNRFAWVASHDLQEPLRTITTQVELLARRYATKLDDQAKHYITTVTSSALRLQQLVEDLLVHAQAAQAGNFKHVALHEVVREVLQDMQMLILQRDATVTMDELPVMWGDRLMLRRLMQNLISNAIKFSKPSSHARVHIGCMPENGHWHIRVRDQGIGIDEAQCERIFGLFQRVHPQSVYPGSGIGLATAKKIVELHKGSIWVESKLGEGSTFHMMLPLMGEELSTENRV